MASNLLELTKNYFNPEVESKLSALTGEAGTNIQVSINSILPILISGLILKTSSKSDASDIMMLVKNGAYDGSILKNFSNSMNDSSKLNMMIQGASSSLDSLFGRKLKSLTNMISKENGISSTSAASLMGFIGASVMNMTGKEILADNLNAAALKNYLSEQQSFLSGLISPEIAGYLGFDSNKPSSLFYFDKNGDNDSSGFKNFMPWILVAICATILLVLWRSCGTDKPPESRKADSFKIEMTERNSISHC